MGVCGDELEKKKNVVSYCCFGSVGQVKLCHNGGTLAGMLQVVVSWVGCYSDIDCYKQTPLKLCIVCVRAMFI